MRKVVSRKQILASTTLAAALTIFGCTTNKMPGDGQPTSMPAVSPASVAPTNGTSGGTRPGTSGGIAPMISSGPASMTTPSVESYAMLAEQQGFRGRILGPSHPGQPSIGANMPPTGQFQSPSAVANPEITVNSSISSGPNPIVINDAGAAVTFVTGATGATAGATTGAVTVAPTTSAVTAASTVTAGGVTAAATAVPTATTAASTVATPAQVTAAAPTPTASAASIPSPTVATNPSSPIILGSAGMTSSAPSSRTRAVRINSTSGLNAVVAPATTSSKSRAVRITTTSSGTALITNTQ